jgi:hypothetical protein
VLRALRRGGHRIDQRREMFRVELANGSSVVVPVDQVEVQWGGQQSFQ